MRKRGVSLIVLIITIVVTIILASVAIMVMNNNNMIGNAEETVFKTDVTTYKHELETYIQNNVLTDVFIEKDDINAEGAEMYAMIPSMKSQDINKFKIYKGELVFIGEGEIEKEWAEQEQIVTMDNVSIGNVKLELVSKTYNSLTLKTTIDGEKKSNYKFIYKLYDKNGEVVAQGETEATNKTSTNTFTFSDIIVKVDEVYSAEVTVEYYEIEKTAVLNSLELEKIVPYFEYNGEDWVTGSLDVTVHVFSTIQGCYLEITTPDGEVIKEQMNKTGASISKNVTVYDNGTITARVVDGSNKEYSTNSCKIENIDNISPTAPQSVELTTTPSTVTAVAVGSVDNDSGFSHYEYSLNGEDWYISNEFTGLVSDTSVIVYARAVDNVGNKSVRMSSDETSTGKLGKVTISPSATSWTPNDVTVTISHSYAGTNGYVLMYNIDGGNWVTLGSTVNSTKITLKDNATVTAKIYNAILDDEGDSARSRQITIIDKVAPNAPTKISTTVSTNSIVATASGATDNYGEISYYEYSKNNSTWSTSGTFKSLSSGTSYTIYARAVDKAGNKSASYKVTVSTKVAIKVSYSGSGYNSTSSQTSGIGTTSVGINVKDITVSGIYTYASSGTMTVTGIPKGAVITFTKNSVTKADNYGTVLASTTATAKYNDVAISSPYTTTADGTFTGYVYTSSEGYGASVTITSIKYNGETLEIVN